MQTIKPWYESKTIWGAAIAVLAMAGSAIGFDMDDAARESAVQSVLQIVGAMGALFSIFGRVVATDMID